MRVLWICGLPEDVRLNGCNKLLSANKQPAWSWILGHMPPEGVELHILCPIGDLAMSRADFEYLGAHWHCFRRERIRHIFAYLRFVFGIKRFVRELRPDVIHGWGGETGFGYMAVRLSRNAIVSVQGLLMLYNALSGKFKQKMSSMIGRYVMWRERETYRRAAVLVNESETARSALKGFYSKAGVVVPQPLRTAFYKDVVIKRLNVPTFVFVGTLTSRKGAVDVVKAFSMIRDPSAKLIMLGDGDARREIEELIGSLRLSGRIILKGACSADEVAESMRRAHFFALPSYADTGPNALKEALASGLFPICYDNSGPHEYLTRYCGYLCRTGDIEAYAVSMKRAISNLDECMRKACEAAVQIKSDLSKSTVWKSLLTVYEGVIK